MEAKKKCDTCEQVGIKSIANYWCFDCEKHFCGHCHMCHNRYHPKHNTRDLDEMSETYLTVSSRRSSISSTSSKDSGFSSGSESTRSSVLSRSSSITSIDSGFHELTDLKCDLCVVMRIYSAAKIWCHDCLNLFCAKCNGYHKAFNPKHNASNLDEVDSSEVILHKSRGVSLDKEIVDHAVSLKKVNQTTRNCIDKLESDCEEKCYGVMTEMVQNAREKADEFCKEIRRITTEEVKRRRQFLEENEKVLRELEKWRIDFHPGVDISGLKSLGVKLSSRLQESIRSERKCQLVITFSNWWLEVKKQMKDEMIGSVALIVDLPAKKFEFKNKFNLGRSDITAIQCDGDDRIFVSDYTEQSVVEFTKQGDFVCECRLTNGTNKFTPWDMCSISGSVIVVCGLERKIIFLEKRKNPSSLQIKKILSTNKEFLSLCEIKESIFACDDFFQIDSFTKEGTKIKTILKGESKGGCLPRIRADPSTGNFWRTKLYSSEISCFNSNGEKLQSVKTGETITDIFAEESGYFYFCNHEGIFSFSPRNILFRFEKESENHCRIFTFKNTIFVCLCIDGQYVIKMLEEVQPKVSSSLSSSIELIKQFETLSLSTSVSSAKDYNCIYRNPDLPSSTILTFTWDFTDQFFCRDPMVDSGSISLTWTWNSMDGVNSRIINPHINNTQHFSPLTIINNINSLLSGKKDLDPRGFSGYDLFRLNYLKDSLEGVNDIFDFRGNPNEGPSSLDNFVATFNFTMKNIDENPDGTFLFPNIFTWETDLRDFGDICGGDERDLLFFISHFPWLDLWGFEDDSRFLKEKEKMLGLFRKRSRQRSKQKRKKVTE